MAHQDLDLTAYGIADGVALGPAGGGMPRLTISGQVCILPFKWRGNTYADCMVPDDGGDDELGAWLRAGASCIQIALHTVVVTARPIPVACLGLAATELCLARGRFL